MYCTTYMQEKNLPAILLQDVAALQVFTALGWTELALNNKKRAKHSIILYCSVYVRHHIEKHLYLVCTEMV
jgi:hypothetical protein